MTEIFGLGLFFDLLNAFYFLIPLVLYVWLVPERIFQKRFHQYVLVFLLFLFTFILLFDAAAEYFFWDEFNSRFNFIAVDYLIYTTEVIGNIQQSYPIEWILAGLFLLSALITYGLKNFIMRPSEKPIRFRYRTQFFAPFLLLPIAGFLLVDNRLHHISSNNFVNELAGNGMYELFAAYRNNELDFETFYPHLTDKGAIDTISKTLLEGDAHRDKDVNSIRHQVTSTLPETKFNVVLISVESFSAEFMSLFGNKQSITPFLDSLAQHSLVFTHLFATGTRTVRGLEALSLSIPPTPGQSIVRRPNNEHLFSMATVFNEKGYESKFIYGGYGYFDNMNYFFSNNGYEVVDRSALNDDEIDYENIWGVADENLFTLASREIEKTVDSHKPSFVHIMTTTNHRPYSYPEGRIDIPSHTGREGAVKYTDYAIGKFIKEARKKDWYANT
ncbi:MAG TPA: LTA synthase family protein, partial [Chryseolinea sp.]|nr:LTA synthase family protein [Chryseolinea sp.]